MEKSPSSGKFLDITLNVGLGLGILNEKILDLSTLATKSLKITATLKENRQAFGLTGDAPERFLSQMCQSNAISSEKVSALCLPEI